MARDFSDDLEIAADGSLVVVDGDVALQQRLRKRLCTNEGEWPFDLEFGVPWLFEILGRNIDAASTRGLVIDALTADFDVVAVSGLESTVDRNSRKARLSATVESISGQRINVN